MSFPFCFCSYASHCSLKSLYKLCSQNILAILLERKWWYIRKGMIFVYQNSSNSNCIPLYINIWAMDLVSEQKVICRLMSLVCRSSTRFTKKLSCHNRWWGNELGSFSNVYKNSVEYSTLIMLVLINVEIISYVVYDLMY